MFSYSSVISQYFKTQNRGFFLSIVFQFGFLYMWLKRTDSAWGGKYWAYSNATWQFSTLKEDCLFWKWAVGGGLFNELGSFSYKAWYYRIFPPSGLSRSSIFICHMKDFGFHSRELCSIMLTKQTLTQSALCWICQYHFQSLLQLDHAAADVIVTQKHKSEGRYIWRG